MSEKQLLRESEKIAFGRPIDWESESQLGTAFFGPHRVFPTLDPGTVQELVDEGLLDHLSRHNEAPPVNAFLELCGWIQTNHGEAVTVGLTGYFKSTDSHSGPNIRIDGLVVRSKEGGELSKDLKRKVTQWSHQTVDYITVDDYEIHVTWD